MALTLPYPNLDFVPLDVLTAEEMNEIVANYTFIANQFPIATANIADSSVTTAKINWPSIQVSSTEKVVGTWVDGSLIYEQTLTGSVQTVVGNVARVTAISDVEQVIAAKGWWQAYSDQWGSFNTQWGNGIFSSVGVRVIDGVRTAELRFFHTQAYSAQYVATLQYTKAS